MPVNLLLIVLLVLLSVVFLFTLFFLNKQKNQLSLQSVNLLKQDLQTISQRVEQLNGEINQRLDNNQHSVASSLNNQLNVSSQLIAKVSANLVKLQETNNQVVSIASELKDLQAVLQNPKQRGMFGEFYLENLLQNVLPPGGFQMQYRFKNASIVDAVIFLDKSKVLPVDSKFSLENYHRLLNAKNELENKHLRQQLKLDLKKRIDETSKYILPQENTMEFAMMFIPSEALYYDLLSNTTGGEELNLIEYAFREKKVIIASPTTFMAYLQTVLQGLKSLQIEKQAAQIQKNVGQLARHLDSFTDYLDKLGKSLGTSIGHYNNAYKQFSSINIDINKISGGQKQLTPQILSKPENLLT